MTIRRWMLVILTFSVAAYTALLVLRWKDRIDRANYHGQAVTGAPYACKFGLAALPKDLGVLAVYYEHDAPRRSWHARLAKKYELAAARPWQPVEPDPPPPDFEGQGFYWYELGEYSKASAAFERAVCASSGNASALNGLAWILATCPEAELRDGRRAVQLATRGCALTSGADASCIDTLAAACAESGDFIEAINLQRAAIGMVGQGDPILKEYRARLALYNANEPSRDAAYNWRLSWGF